ncbi:MAG TPA: NADH-quinone oxidoreductase subunit L [Mycobacteriales bacterium]|nr:NADH-quinone oxidoreductase subunit L [Mycobacteriales bacterium]
MTYAYPQATGIFDLTAALVALPLLGAAVLLLGGRRANRWGHLLGCGTIVAAFLVGLALFLAMFGHHPSQRTFDEHLFHWIPVAGFQVSANLLIDPLSMLFVLLITGVGALIHIYSIGYMAHDLDRRRFFGQLNLFVAAMLLLVLADNFLLLYVGWEGVGLASYLLIGFWSYKPSAATAAKKAFIVNRVGDVGLLLAIMLMFATFGSTSFDAVFTGASSGLARTGTLTAIGLLLAFGGCGKSAQFPLQSWLADAMEGPTPVSALIHAATMVTAGVYLIARSSPIFNGAPVAQLAVACTGALTLLGAAVIGCAYDDIKRVLAYSTVSQIGYMFLAVGLGPVGYAFGILHLLAHGFFKAGLFLGAGSVMHGMNDQVDMRRFGGLRKVMPVTFATFGLAYLAIIGFPGLSGFWTKDKIIEAAFDYGGATGYALGVAALVGVAVTAFYMTRLMVLTFFGKSRWTEDVHPHESPRVMTVPMIVLSVGSVLFGALFTLAFPLVDWLRPVLPTPGAVAHTLNPLVLSLLGIASMAGGILGAVVQYGRREIPVAPPVAVSGVTRAARSNLYGDAFNEAVFMRPGQYLARALVFFDGRGVDGAVNGIAASIGGTSGRLRRWQTGFVRSYALSMFLGAAVVAIALLLVRVG